MRRDRFGSIVCFDGKRHRWRKVCDGNRYHCASGTETRWCEKCGSLTVFIKEGKRFVRMRDEERGGILFIDEPITLRF